MRVPPDFIYELSPPVLFLVVLAAVGIVLVWRANRVVNFAAGAVETMMSIDSPAFTLCREQYPSIHGERKPSDLSRRTRVSCQSLVPFLAFSCVMTLLRADCAAA